MCAYVRTHTHAHAHTHKHTHTHRVPSRPSTLRWLTWGARSMTSPRASCRQCPPAAAAPRGDPGPLVPGPCRLPRFVVCVCVCVCVCARARLFVCVCVHNSAVYVRGGRGEGVCAAQCVWTFKRNPACHLPPASTRQHVHTHNHTCTVHTQSLKSQALTRVSRLSGQLELLLAQHRQQEEALVAHKRVVAELQLLREKVCVCV